MSTIRVIGRTLFAAAKGETSSAAAASTATSRHNLLEDFFEAERSPDDDKPVVYGRGWKASELRLKSWDDLLKLWYVLLKEKNMLMTQLQMLHAQDLRFPNPERISKMCIVENGERTTGEEPNLCAASCGQNRSSQQELTYLVKVRKSMCRIKHVLTERAIEDPDPRRSAEMKRMINAL